MDIRLWLDTWAIVLVVIVDRSPTSCLASVLHHGQNTHHEMSGKSVQGFLPPPAVPQHFALRKSRSSGISGASHGSETTNIDAAHRIEVPWQLQLPYSDLLPSTVHAKVTHVPYFDSAPNETSVELMNASLDWVLPVMPLNKSFPVEVPPGLFRRKLVCHVECPRHYLVDEATCSCRSACLQFICTAHCPHGAVKDELGCDTCQCLAGGRMVAKIIE